MAKLLALILCFALVSGCMAKWNTCQLEINYPCAGSKPGSCVNTCGSAVGGDLLTEANCRRREGSSRGANVFYCQCIFDCPPREQNKPSSSQDRVQNSLP